MSDDVPPEHLQGAGSDGTAMVRGAEHRPSVTGRSRMRGTLSLVRGIVRRSAASSTSVEDYAALVESRIDAVIRTQALMLGQRKEVDLYGLVASELLAHAAWADTMVDIQGPDVHLQPAAAEVMAVTIHELAINAITYGGLSRPEGRVGVGWTVDRPDEDAPLLTFAWRESAGPAPLPAPPSRRGFGMDMLDNVLPHELKAETRLAFTPGGLCCTLRFPLLPRIGNLTGGQAA